PGSAWLMTTGCGVVVVGTVVVLDEASVSAAVRWTSSVITATARNASGVMTANAMRSVFILMRFARRYHRGNVGIDLNRRVDGRKRCNHLGGFCSTKHTER